MAILKDSERTMIQDLEHSIERLSANQQERLMWMIEGILFASKRNDKE